MFRLLHFDVARALRPSAATVARRRLAGLGRVPASLHGDLGLGGGMLLTRATEYADRHLAERHRRDAAWLLAILCGLAARRGFGALEWDVEAD